MNGLKGSGTGRSASQPKQRDISRNGREQYTIVYIKEKMMLIKGLLHCRKKIKPAMPEMSEVVLF